MSRFAAACFRALALVMACSILIFSLVDPGFYPSIAGWCQILFGGCGVAEVFVYRRSVSAIRQAGEDHVGRYGSRVDAFHRRAVGELCATQQQRHARPQEYPRHS